MLHLECLDEPFPRYRLIYDSVAFDDETALRALRDGRFDPLRVVILDRPWPHPSAVSTSVMSTVQLQSRKPEELQFQVQSSQAGFLVIGDVWDPGWQAVVDGQPAPVLRAYMALRAVPLPPGNHIVRLYYSPLSLRVGLLLSALSLGILVIWALQPDWFPRR
jgi:hypothetical protein